MHRNKHLTYELADQALLAIVDLMECHEVQGLMHNELDRAADTVRSLRDGAADAPSVLGTWTTPKLVREYAEIKMADVRGEIVTEGQHRRLGAVVDELRSRKVLD